MFIYLLKEDDPFYLPVEEEDDPFYLPVKEEDDPFYLPVKEEDDPFYLPVEEEDDLLELEDEVELPEHQLHRATAPHLQINRSGQGPFIGQLSRKERDRKRKTRLPN